MAPTYTGSCKCGAIQIALEGEPAFVGLCHCRNCRKSSGSAFSTNAIFMSSVFSITEGTAKEFQVTGGSGNPAYVYFCDTCSATMWTKSPLRPEIVVVKMGILDGDAMDKLTPSVETFTSRKPKWVGSIEGAAQCEEAYRPAAEPAKS